ncbi:hypothetical protein [Mycoplasmopsis columboralis]|uniref:Uncharacterized protein n=1 Tax=Mycoplasmopsis columboralis TaxID=171282 RepID=A0A449B610_9BACT|nr:hypothetical protein [Mycoplasmopsis columboralis]VEU76005.1 Uncharacterised protein [Mycoplasmopsis columboralis]
MKPHNRSVKEVEFIANLIELKKTSNDINGYIASELLSRNKKGTFISQAKEFCEEIGVSPSAFTFFSRKIKLNNVKEIVYIHNQLIENREAKIKDTKNTLAKDVAKLINSSNKIHLVGVSGAAGMNMDLQIQLLRMNKNCIQMWNKYEQIGLSKILTENDLVIVNSISLQHQWMIKIMEMTSAKIVLISSWIPEHLESKISYFYKISTNERQDGLRIFTSEGREKTLAFYNSILKELRSDPTNYEYLTRSSYRE